jgi:putative chitinase
MNLVVFFDAVRRSPFDGRLSQGQVDGLSRLLAAWEASGYRDLRWLAYILATAFHETGRKMQPVEEVGGRSRPYGRPDPVTGKRYYGRGDVQLTHKENYARAGRLVGLDLVDAPDLALRPDVSARILVEGMAQGLFTGRKLADHLGDTTDWVGARRIVNGLDRAAQIAGYACSFHAALLAAQAPLPSELDKDAHSADGHKRDRSPSLAAKLVLAAFGALAAALAAILGVK